MHLSEAKLLTSFSTTSSPLSSVKPFTKLEFKTRVYEDYALIPINKIARVKKNKKKTHPI